MDELEGVGDLGGGWDCRVGSFMGPGLQCCCSEPMVVSLSSFQSIENQLRSAKERMAILGYLCRALQVVGGWVMAAYRYRWGWRLVRVEPVGICFSGLGRGEVYPYLSLVRGLAAYGTFHGQFSLVDMTSRAAGSSWTLDLMLFLLIWARLFASTHMVPGLVIRGGGYGGFGLVVLPLRWAVWFLETQLNLVQGLLYLEESMLR